MFAATVVRCSLSQAQATGRPLAQHVSEVGCLPVVLQGSEIRPDTMPGRKPVRANNSNRHLFALLQHLRQLQGVTLSGHSLRQEQPDNHKP